MKAVSKINSFHVCIDCRFLDASGIGRYIRNIITFLVREENNIYITFITYSKHLSFFEHLGNENCNIVISKNSMYSLKEQFELPLKIPGCDLYWSPHYPIPFLPIKAKKRLVTIHDANHLALSKDLSLVQKIYAQIMMRLSTRLNQKILTMSYFSKNEIIRYTGINSQKIVVTYSGIDNQKFQLCVNQNHLRNIKEQYRFPKRFLLYVGNIKPHKNIRKLLYAFALVKDKFIGLKLVIVGNKKNFINGIKGLDKLLEDLKIKKQVIFTGFLDDIDLPFVYNLATVFVFPSLYEGFGLPPLEAMACGCPVVASNAASIPEVCGDAAFYVNPNDEKDIARGIMEVLTNTDLREKLIVSGLERVKNFTWEKAAFQTLEVIKDMIKRN